MIAQHREKIGNSKLNQLEIAALFGVRIPSGQLVPVDKGRWKAKQ